MGTIVIDIGNSRQKAAVWEAGELLEFSVSERISLSLLTGWQQKYGVRYLACSSVAQPDSAFLAALASQFEVHFPEQLPVPFEMAYQTPATLGTDRLACMAAAAALYPRRSVLVVQCGSCLTFDLLHENVYRGGSISPGLLMRFKALHAFTARLPQLSPQDDVPLVGDSTSASIQAGVWQGYLAECEGMIEKYCAQYENLIVILTGGDAERLKDKLKKTIFAQPHMVLCGLGFMLDEYIKNQ